MASYREIGGQLGAYIRAKTRSTAQVQAFLADLMAGDELLGTMRDVAGKPSLMRWQSTSAHAEETPCHCQHLLNPLPAARAPQPPRSTSPPRLYHQLGVRLVEITTEGALGDNLVLSSLDDAALHEAVASGDYAEHEDSPCISQRQ